MSQDNFNLLEYYASHRKDVAILRDPQAMFALGFLDSVGPTPRAILQSDLGVEPSQLDGTVDQLYKAGFLSTQGSTLAVTPQGHQFLLDMGLAGPLPPPSSPNESQPEPPAGGPARVALEPAPAGTPWLLYGLIAALIIGALGVFGIFVSRPGRDDPTRTGFETTVPPTRVPPTIAPQTRTTPVGSDSVIGMDAGPLTIKLGDCGRVSWAATNAREVFLNNKPVRETGVETVCPTETTVYILTVITNDNQKLTETRTITVVSPETATFAPQTTQTRTPAPSTAISLSAPVRAMRFDPSGKLVYVGLVTGADKPGMIAIHDAENGTRVGSIELPTAFVPNTLAISPDGQRLYAVGVGVAAIDLRTRQVVQRSLPHHGLIGGALLSRDGKWLFASTATTIEILNTETLEFVESLQVGGRTVFHALRWSSDGNLLYAPRSNDLLLIFEVEFARTPTAKLVSRIPVPGSPIDAIPSTDDTRLYVPLFFKNSIAVVNIKNRSVESEIPLPYGVKQMDISPDGTIAAGASVGYAYLLDTKSGQQTQYELAAKYSLTSLSPDGSQLWTADPTLPEIQILRLTQ
jgi:DNA-binding beta-propeller fold protein YncE